MSRPRRRGRIRAHPAQTVFELARPAGPGFWRPASCEDVGCGAYLSGWETVLPAGDPRCDYIRSESGRRFTELATGGGLVVFAFPPGQRCFAAADHQLQVQREPLYLVRGSRPRQHTRGEFWVEDMSERLDVVRDRRGC